MKYSAKCAIVVTFKELINQKSFDKITVKEICDHCNINRQTFYNYYTDIMDVFKCIFIEELSAQIAQNRSLENWSGGFLATLNYLKDNSKMIKNIYRSTYWPEANRFCVNLSIRLLEDVVEECIEKKGVKLKEKDRSFIINFYKHVFYGLIIDWVTEGMIEEPEIILKKLLLMITGSIPRSVDAFANEEKNIIFNKQDETASRFTCHE